MPRRNKNAIGKETNKKNQYFFHGEKLLKELQEQKQQKELAQENRE